MAKSTAAPVTAEFDLDALTGEDMQEMADAERTLNMRKMAEIFTRIVTRTSLGKADDPATYLKSPALKMLRINRMLAEAMTAEASAEKNSPAPSTTG